MISKMALFLILSLMDFFSKFSGVSAAALVLTTLNKQHCSTLSIRHILPKCTYSSLVSKQQIAFDFYSLCRCFARMSFLLVVILQ